MKKHRPDRHRLDLLADEPDAAAAALQISRKKTLARQATKKKNEARAVGFGPGLGRYPQFGRSVLGCIEADFCN